MRFQLLCAMWSLCVFVAAMCGACSDDRVAAAKSAADEAAEQAADAVAAKIEAKLADFVQCQGWANKGVVERVGALLKDRDQLTASDLLRAPDGVARLAARSWDVSEVTKRLSEVAQVFAGPVNLFEGSAPSWSVDDCDAIVDVPCLTGSATLRASCEGGNRANAGKGTFDQCNLSTLRLDGALDIHIASNAEVTLAFEDLSIGDNTVLNGALALSWGVTETGLFVEVGNQSTDKLVISQHGGHASGLSCGRTIEISRLRMKKTDTALSAEVAFAIKTKDGSVAVQSVSPHLNWTFGQQCHCPNAGSAAQLVTSRPGGDKGEMITVLLTFGAATATGCRGAQLSFPDWPTDCSLQDKIVTACGEQTRDAVALVGSALASQVCVRTD